VGIFYYTHNTIGRGTRKKHFVFIWVAVKMAFVGRQAGRDTDLFTAEYTGTVTFLGTERE
jgi:hypothetical protein